VRLTDAIHKAQPERQAYNRDGFRPRPPPRWAARQNLREPSAFRGPPKSPPFRCAAARNGETDRGGDASDSPLFQSLSPSAIH
jgi:hypothetical protein